ncbi:MAG: DnaJ family molecular chaperone [Rhodothalassiaceae bacterium]
MRIWTSIVDTATDLLRRLAGETDEADGAQRRISFTIGVIALAAKMAKADGEVTQDEVETFRTLFKVPPHETKNVTRVYDMAKQDTAGYETYARQIARLFTGSRAVLEELLDALFHIARADGTVHPGEMAFLRRVAEIFGLSEAEFESLAARHVGPDRASPYTVLGVTPDISDEELKATWRRLVRETHPDKLMAEGMPREFLAVAHDRLAAINAAYERIKAQRDIV